ncbi:MAG: YoaK family protein [Lachnospiraceae bacterium]|nr:YoaK family protein [Lachnospiraceae bacterium]
MKKLIRRHAQMSEAPITIVFLTLSGALQDSYSYLIRNKVFANAQTGNIVLMSQHFFTGDVSGGLHYLIPIFAFALGVFAAERIGASVPATRHIHWRQIVVLFEIALLFAVGLLPHPFDVAANALTSFACAMQVQAFRKISGYGFASTMCIGNLRSGMESLSVYFRTREEKTLDKALHYFGVIAVFAVGAGLGAVFAPMLGIRMIWISCGFLVISFLLMLLEDLERREQDAVGTF